MSCILTFTNNHFEAIIYLPKLLLWSLVRELKQIGKYLAKVINSKFKSKNTVFVEYLL
jgi:hypothetical protein